MPKPEEAMSQCEKCLRQFCDCAEILELKSLNEELVKRNDRYKEALGLAQDALEDVEYVPPSDPDLYCNHCAWCYSGGMEKHLEDCKRKIALDKIKALTQDSAKRGG